MMSRGQHVHVCLVSLATVSVLDTMVTSAPVAPAVERSSPPVPRCARTHAPRSSTATGSLQNKYGEKYLNHLGIEYFTSVKT